MRAATPNNPKPRAVVVGRLAGVFGIRGEIKCVPAPGGSAAFAAGRSYRVGEGPAERELRCRSARKHHEKLLLAFDGFETPEAVRALAGATLRAERSDAPLADGEYLDADLVGLRLTDERGGDIGRIVVAVEHYPAQDCLVVEPGRKLVPLVKAFVRRIDLAAGTIATTLPEGLFD